MNRKNSGHNLDECEFSINVCTLKNYLDFIAKDILAIPYSSQNQYNCCKKINCGSEYPFTADLNKVSDVGDWLSATGSSMWWSSVLSGRARGKVTSEGFTSRASDNGLFCMDSCSLRVWSTLASRVLSAPEMERKKKVCYFYKTNSWDNLLSIPGFVSEPKYL